MLCAEPRRSVLQWQHPRLRDGYVRFVTDCRDRLHLLSGRRLRVRVLQRQCLYELRGQLAVRHQSILQRRHLHGLQWDDELAESLHM